MVRAPVDCVCSRSSIDGNRICVRSCARESVCGCVLVCWCGDYEMCLRLIERSPAFAGSPIASAGGTDRIEEGRALANTKKKDKDGGSDGVRVTSNEHCTRECVDSTDLVLR